MLFEYATKREAIQAGWAYAHGRLDERGEGDLPREANADAFGEEYGRVWEAKRELARGFLPGLSDAWENWLRCHDSGLPLQLFDENCCCSCGDHLLSIGMCSGGRCVPVSERKLYLAFRTLAQAFEREEQSDAAEAALNAADVIAEFGSYPRDGDTLSRWRELYVAYAVA